MITIIKVSITLWLLESSNAVEWEDEAVTSASKFSDNVNEFVDQLLGHKNLQKHYNELSFTQRKLDGNDILDKMVIDIGQKMFDRNNAIKHLKTIVQDSLTSTNVSKECCELRWDDFEYDYRFKNRIANEACYRQSKLTKQEFGFLSAKFEEACADNIAKMPSLRWQYFASESGITTLYPAIKEDDCDSYDARFRPFYVRTLVPEPKDVVVVIDKSGSMEQRVDVYKTLMDIAKDAAKTVISTLNPHDRVAVIGFSTTVVALGNNPNEACFSDHLAMVTAYNVKSMDQFIDRLPYGGQTYYGKALSKAFDYFDNSPANKNRDRVILFLSDGIPADKGEDIFKILKERNQKLNNSVILMTYGLGNAADFTILRKMAEQDGSDYGVTNEDQIESAKPGLFTHVHDPKDMKQEMASYYTFFSKRPSLGSKSEPIWSLPYAANWESGIMISISLPINNVTGDVVGVVGVDMTLDDLLSAAVFFRPSELSYVFIIDHSGFVIHHPLFDYPEYLVRYTDILAIETDAGMIEVINDMKNGGSGSKTFRSQRVRPGGSRKLYGVKTFSVSTKAYWKQIPHSEFSLCVVLAEEDQESTLQNLGPRSGENFLYHRIDLVPPQNPCEHYNNYCAMNQTVVSLGPRAFVDKNNYFNTEETASSVISLTRFMDSGRGGDSIEEGIRNSVWATQEAERYWKINSDSELERYVMWKYVGTKEGMIRMYPGAQFPKGFDSTVRPWYKNSIANKKDTTFTLRYADAVSGEYVFTITKVIYEGRNVTRNQLEDKVVAVMGVDILVSYFDSMFRDNFPVCFGAKNFGCVLIDSAGFLMQANYFFYRQSRIPVHITEKEPLIAKSLIARNIMRRSSCLAIEETYLQRTYEIYETQYFSANASGNCFEYQFIPIPGTNIYLIIRGSENSCSNNQGSCPCSHFFYMLRACISDSDSCECPCTKLYENYNACSNKYDYSSEESVPKSCVPDPKPLREVRETNIDILPPCSKYSFDKDILTSTYSFTTTTNNNESISVPHITTAAATTDGTYSSYFFTTTITITTTDVEKTSGPNNTAIADSGAFGLIAMSIIIVNIVN